MDRVRGFDQQDADHASLEVRDSPSELAVADAEQNASAKTQPARGEDRVRAVRALRGSKERALEGELPELRGRELIRIRDEPWGRHRPLGHHETLPGEELVARGVLVALASSRARSDLSDRWVPVSGGDREK
jgi:hypothetical protein